MRGFQEAPTSFGHADQTGLLGQVRRFGAQGPAYEVVGLNGDGSVQISVIQSGEELAYAVDELIADPLAQSIP